MYSIENDVGQVHDAKLIFAGCYMNTRIKQYIGPMRVPFLILAPACALLGIASAYLGKAEIAWWDILLIVFGAICAHIGVNAYNEYHDFKSNLDAKTVKTPFSGGSGTLQEEPRLSRYTVVMATAALVVTGGIGVYFAISSSLLILPFGILGAVMVVFYTPFIVRRPLLCLLAPGIGFGPCMVIGTHIALSGAVSWSAVLVSAVPFFLVSNLLLLNQFPDIEADRNVGRRNLPIVAGSRLSAVIYCAFLLMSYLAVVLGVALAVIPALALLGLLTVPIAVVSCIGALRFDGSAEKLMPGLGMNVLTVLITPVLVSVGMFFGG